MARPVSWHKKIVGADALAMEFYSLITKIQKSKSFVDCHVFTGAKIDDIPHIAFEKTTTNLPKMICGFLGVPYRKRLCGTPGCMNPFHHANVAIQGGFAPPDRLETPVLAHNSMEDYRELINYVADEHEISVPYTYEKIRPLIPCEDMDDDTLKEALK